MLNWQDTGIVLDKSLFGESDIILDVFTENHGRVKGLIRHGKSSKHAGTYQQGNLLSVTWKARLEEHLGTFTAEMIKSYSSPVLGEQLKLDVLTSALSEVKSTLPEREENQSLFLHLQTFFGSLNGDNFLYEFILWELSLLKALGFALNLSECALTGSKENLAFVSPKTGRAVSATAAGKWTPYLLPLPEFLTADIANISTAELLDGIALTGYFLKKHIFTAGMPAARSRLIESLQRSQTIKDVKIPEPNS